MTATGVFLESVGSHETNPFASQDPPFRRTKTFFPGLDSCVSPVFSFKTYDNVIDLRVVICLLERGEEIDRETVDYLDIVEVPHSIKNAVGRLCVRNRARLRGSAERALVSEPRKICPYCERQNPQGAAYCGEGEIWGCGGTLEEDSMNLVDLAPVKCSGPVDYKTLPRTDKDYALDWSGK